MRFTLCTLVLAACSSYGDGTSPETPVPDRDAGSDTGDVGDAAVETAVDSAGTDASSDADADAADAPAVDSGRPCNGDVNCARLVFVSSSKGDGAQGGLAGADTECQELADASPFTSGHKFKAWLSVGGSFAKDRLPQGAFPYRRVDNAVVANSFSDLIDGTLLQPINRDENNLAVATESVWTGTHANGSGSGANCNNWSDATGGTNGRTGTVGRTDSGWSDDGDAPCNTSLRIYCIEN